MLTRTTAYHPQGDGMVERLNRSLLQLLRVYVDKEADWERFLPFVLYAYRTAVHSATGVSPFELMFGRQPAPNLAELSAVSAFDPTSYQALLRAKLAELQDLVELNLVEAAFHQKVTYDQHSLGRSFKIGDPVWLSVPTAGKLDPRWKGRWTIKSVLSPIAMEIADGRRSRVVHVNRLRQRIQPRPHEPSGGSTCEPQRWDPHQVDHLVYAPPDISSPNSRYPQRDCQPLDRFGV